MCTRCEGAKQGKESDGDPRWVRPGRSGFALFRSGKVLFGARDTTPMALRLELKGSDTQMGPQGRMLAKTRSELSKTVRCTFYMHLNILIIKRGQSCITKLLTPFFRPGDQVTVSRTGNRKQIAQPQFLWFLPYGITKQDWEGWRPGHWQEEVHLCFQGD